MLAQESFSHVVGTERPKITRIRPGTTKLPKRCISGILPYEGSANGRIPPRTTKLCEFRRHPCSGGGLTQANLHIKSLNRSNLYVILIMTGSEVLLSRRSLRKSLLRGRVGIASRLLIPSFRRSSGTCDIGSPVLVIHPTDVLY